MDGWRAWGGRARGCVCVVGVRVASRYKARGQRGRGRGREGEEGGSVQGGCVSWATSKSGNIPNLTPQQSPLYGSDFHFGRSNSQRYTCALCGRWDGQQSAAALEWWVQRGQALPPPPPLHPGTGPVPARHARSASPAAQHTGHHRNRKTHTVDVRPSQSLSAVWTDVRTPALWAPRGGGLTAPQRPRWAWAGYKCLMAVRMGA